MLFFVVKIVVVVTVVVVVVIIVAVGSFVFVVGLNQRQKAREPVLVRPTLYPSNVHWHSLAQAKGSNLALKASPCWTR